MLKNNYKVICNIVCAVLVLALLVLQFLPGYWTCQKTKPEEDGTYKTEAPSLQLYMWAPSEFSTLEKNFDKQFGDELIMNDVVMMPVIALVFGVLCILFSVIRSQKSWVAIFPAFVGGFGVYGYLCYPIFQMNNMWVIHLMLCVLIFAVAITAIIASVIGRILAFRKELAELAQRTY